MSAFPYRRRRQLQRGAILVWTILALTAMMAACALSVDASYWYEQRAEIQRVSDCAALVYAWTAANQNQVNAQTAFNTIIAEYGFTSGGTNTVTPDYEGNPYWYHVHLAKTIPPIFGAVGKSITRSIDAASTADYNVPLLPGNDPLYYGVANANIPVVLQVNGPTDAIQEGDNYSSETGVNGEPNPLHTGFLGYDFLITVPANYYATFGSSLQVQIYDPQCYNENSDDTQWPDLDLIRDSASSFTFSLEDVNYNVLATATYTMPYSTSSNYKNAWITPSGFTVTPNNGTITYYHVFVQATAGESQNGFLLRAGPPDSNLNTGATCNSSGTLTTADYFSSADPIYSTSWYTSNNGGYTYSAFHALSAAAQEASGSAFYNSNSAISGLVTWHQKWADQGTMTNSSTTIAETDSPATASPDLTNVTVAAVGVIPIIFTNNGTAKLIMGSVPTGSTSITITDFDAGDEGTTTKALYYECSSLADSTQSDGLEHFAGNLTGDGLSYTQTITLPSNYTTGIWTAQYTSSVMDMSTWQVTYVGPATAGVAGDVGLISTTTEGLD
ncbi:MAG: TadE/TadG family type IV pilus assembly protein [Capsulimonadaceae bacterium]